jgi:hypothetical protein
MRRPIGVVMAGLVLTAAGGEAHARAKHATAPSSHAPRHATESGKSSAAPGGAACADSAETALWWSPEAPAAGATIKLLAVGEESGAGELSATDPAGTRHALTVARHPGVPGSLSAELAAPHAGAYRVTWTRGDRTLACRTIEVTAHALKPDTSVGKVVWPATHGWDRRYENFFSAWIDVLFDAPPDASLDFRPLHQALRDPARNFLMNFLGLREDDPKNKAAITATPDCADLPYFLRAYFSWKMGLPFGFRDCDRGTDARPPRCTGFFSNEDPPSGKETLGSIRSFLRLMGNHVQSGSARTALDDDATDYYPVALEKKALRPGTIYADPYGHVMMVVKWVAQNPARGGLLLAVDGQPDTSIGRKRFWEGTFLFANDVKSAGPGFKAFRPVARGADGHLASVPNKAIGGADDPAHAPFSDEQAKLTQDAFYARMGKLINPQGLEAEAAYRETLDALAEQLTVRVGSVDNGEKFQKEKGPVVIPMPDGAKIFEATGPWEDYATPSRDMRLLIAMNVLLGIPDRIVKHPDLFKLGGRKPEVVRAEIAKLHASLIPTRGITYTRSDSSPQKLTVADLLSRRAALEIAYNPNDCVETRWGAAEGTPEAAACSRHAPPEQKAKMAEVRVWFHEARRPAR